MGDGCRFQPLIFQGAKQQTHLFPKVFIIFGYPAVSFFPGVYIHTDRMALKKNNNNRDDNTCSLFIHVLIISILLLIHVA